jgi:hypothetical protein
MHELTFESTLIASPQAVWEHASRLRGINEELFPLHMSGPQDMRIDGSLPLGEPLLHSVVTLFRVLPIDVHRFVLLKVDEGRGFHEDSTSLSERRWVHIRTLTPNENGGCIVRDELRFEPRMLASLITAIIRNTFDRRHARLRAKFGGRRAGG